MMADGATAKRLLRAQEDMAAARAPFEGRWRQLGELVWPAHGDFSRFRSDQAPSPDRDFDSTAKRAAARFAALLVQVMTPQHEKWHHLRPLGPAARSHAAMQHMEQLRDQLFDMRYRPKSGFANGVFEGFMQLGVFGTGVLFLGDRPGRGLTYRAVPLAEIFIGTDDAGVVDRVHRRYRLAARQMAGAFPGATLPERVVQAAEKSPETRFEILHCVEQRPGADPERLDAMGMPWASWHLLTGAGEGSGATGGEGGTVLRESGYRTMPYLVFRYLGTPNNDWGLSPADVAFADVRMVNRMEKSQLNAANRAADPIWLAADDNLPAPKLVPNAINPGWLDPNTGRAMIQALESSARLDIGEAKLEQKRQSIESAFLGDFFKTLIENPNMKATQVLELAAARAEQTAPFIARTQEELFGPMIERELDVQAAAGVLPPPPAEILESGGEYRVEYDSPISRSLRSGEAVGIMRLTEAALQIEGLQPGSRLVIDGDEALRRLGAAYGVPVNVLRGERQVAQLRQAAADAEEQAGMVEAAPGLAGAAKDLAKAGQALQPAGGQPSGGAANGQGARAA